MNNSDLAAILLDSSPDGLLLVDDDGLITLANRSASNIFGYRIDELVGMRVEQLVPREHRATHDEHRRRFHDDPTRRPMGTGLQLFGEHEDGSMFPVEISLSPVTLEGRVQTIATVRDVTERQESLARVTLLRERERIARDLHDMVIQRLFAAGMSLQAIAGSVEPPAAVQRILSVTDELDETIRELRAAIFQLGQPDPVRSLAAHVASLVDDKSAHLGFHPTLEIVGDVDDVPEHVTEQLSATLNEALSNVARHAGATEAHVRIERDHEHLRLVVTDNGVGIVEIPKPLGGLSNMMWRAAELGGACSIAPAAPSGTRLDWYVPV